MSHPARTLAAAITALTSLLLTAGCGDDDVRDGGASTSSTPSSTPTSASTSPSTSVDEPTLAGRYPVTKDGRELAIVCWGTGSPTVLLETGGVNIEEWTGSGMVRALAGLVRVCTYDRAGTGTSDPAPDERRDAEDVVTDADALLKAAGIAGPLVLVGRSFGGMIVTHYAEVRPAGVVGVVVLDTPAPSAEFTVKSEPGLAWDYPGNVEHLDVVRGFENRFANDPPHVDVPVLVVSPVEGEASPHDEAFWLQVGARARQVTCMGEPDAGGPCADAVVGFVQRLRG